MSSLQDYFERNPGRRIDKWMHYFEIYERHFARFRGRPVHVMEIGVYHGGSLQMWKHYFGAEARIFGVDIHPGCKALEEERIRIFIGDQADRDFLRTLRAEVPRIDILLDDGGHRMDQQLATLEELYPHVSPDGVYACEDLHTSYWPEYGGGYRKSGSFIERSKELIDRLNAWHFREPDPRPDDFTLSTHSLHFYPSMLVIEKRAMAGLRAGASGTASPEVG
jgi:methyltransferase family protein